MEELLITENVIISDLLLADPALLLHLLVALGTAGKVITHEEHLGELHCAELAPEAGLVVELAQGKETIICQGLQTGGTLLLKILKIVEGFSFNSHTQQNLVYCSRLFTLRDLDFL